VLVSEILLQRSRSGTVAGVLKELFSRWPDADSLAQARVEDIEEMIRPLGLVRRATFLKRLAALVAERGEVPASLQEMVLLPGVGRYAAAATLSSAFDQRQPTVDGTSARVYRRYFGLEAIARSSVDSELWKFVERVMPRGAFKEWNWAVLDLAAQICLPRRPRCPECPLVAKCSVGSRGVFDTVSD
jgi:A/G-specific adenine glycosylase